VPVLAATRLTDEANPIRLVNSPPYGLAASVWTRRGGRQPWLALAEEPAGFTSTITALAVASRFPRQHQGSGFGRAKASEPGTASRRSR
jgi:acyl-CoA reductase-like NAD-dependent aldehyde dehydrogenase